MEGAPIMEDPSIVKGKRTKRQRLHFPSSAAAAAAAPSSSSNSAEEFSESVTEQDEETANSLIQLAQGPHKPGKTATTTSGKAGVNVYECKTCSKSFPTFQALGGHRASHKKPKLENPPAAEAAAAVMVEESIQLSMNLFGPAAAAAAAAGKARIHECSTCHEKFNSGQALGGHMRRHRTASVQVAAKKEGNSSGLSLDLNLPAPAEDEDDGNLGNSASSPVLGAKTPPLAPASKTPILLLTSSLVDCFY